MKRLTIFAFFAILYSALMGSGAQAPSAAAVHKLPVQPRPSAAAPSPAPTLPGLILGAAWYPEHWPESRWEEDLRLMQAAESTWCASPNLPGARMEPEEGKFEFGWLERAVALAARA